MKARIGGIAGLSPRQLLGVIVLVAALMIPAAVAWACNPQPTLKISPGPGESMTVQGRNFSGKEVTITTDPPDARVTVPLTKGGTFKTRLATPKEPGSYAVLAQSTPSKPGATPPPPARSSFTTSSAPAPTEQPPQSRSRVFSVPRIARSSPSPSPSPSPEPATGGSSSGGSSSGGSSSGGSSSGGSSSGGGPGGGPGGGSGGGFGGGSGGGFGGGSGAGFGNGNAAPASSGSGSQAAAQRSGVIRDASGRGVFADSAAPADRRAGAAGRSTTTNSDGGPSERAATDDLWSGFRSGKTPSLIGGGGDGSVDDGTAGVPIGLGLLALGLLGLVTGLAVAEARRRRAIAG